MFIFVLRSRTFGCRLAVLNLIGSLAIPARAGVALMLSFSGAMAFARDAPASAQSLPVIARRALMPGPDVAYTRRDQLMRNETVFIRPAVEKPMKLTLHAFAFALVAIVITTGSAIAGEALDRIKKEGVVRIGLNNQYPFAFKE